MRIIAIVALLGTLSVSSAQACSCRSTVVEAQILRATHVFRARVTSAELLTPKPGETSELTGYVKAQVEILGVLKGTPALLDGVYTHPQRSACGVPIVIGHNYVFFLTEKGVTSRCSGTLAQGLSFGASGVWFDFIKRYGMAHDY